MPTKLVILLAWMGLGTLLSLITQNWLQAIVTAGLGFGILRGAEGARGILLGFAALTALWGVFLLVSATLIYLGRDALVQSVVVALMGVLAGVQGLFMMWCLRQRDVQRWMFEKSLKHPV